MVCCRAVLKPGPIDVALGAMDIATGPVPLKLAAGAMFTPKSLRALGGMTRRPKDLVGEDELDAAIEAGRRLSGEGFKPPRRSRTRAGGSVVWSFGAV